VLGQHYQGLRRLDFAALLYYRTAEGCFSERLKLGYGGFDCSRPDYGRLPVPEDQVLATFNLIRTKLGRSAAARLPQKIGLVDAAIILHALDDGMLHRLKITNDRGLSHLVQLTEGRNMSLLAHGQQRVAVDQCEQLEGEARQMLRALWELHGPPGENIHEVCEGLRFLREV
jgi:CRISPR-associated protein (Cas_Cas02710)